MKDVFDHVWKSHHFEYLIAVTNGKTPEVTIVVNVRNVYLTEVRLYRLLFGKILGGFGNCFNCC